MLLKICEDNWLFFISHTKYMDIFCYCIIIVCAIFCMHLYNKSYFENKNIMKKASVVVVSLLFVGFLSFVLVNTMNKKEFEGCSCYVATNHSKIITSNMPENSIKDIVHNKVIIIGDSRMSFIASDDNIEIPTNVSFIAKSAMKIDWFESEAIEKLENQLNNANSNYQYHVVFNMGVNDLNSTTDGYSVGEKYYKLYRRVTLKYPNVKFYLLSINPISERRINRYFSNNLRTSESIVDANETMLLNLINDHFDNLSYCNSYENIKFNTRDGLHYTRDTNQSIINYIVKSCVKY